MNPAVPIMPMHHLRRWGLLWAVAGISMVLVGSALSVHLRIQAHAHEMAQIHGQFVLSKVPEATADGPLPAQELLHRLRPFGVHAVWQHGPDGELLQSAGRRGRDGVTQGPPTTDGPASRGDHRLTLPTEHGTTVVAYAPLLALDLIRQSAIGLATALAASGALLVLATLWVRHREQLQLAEAEQLRTRHLAHLGTLSAVVAHELRNPLTVLTGHAQLLREDLPNNPQVRHVETGALRLNELLNSLLAFAETGDMQPEPVSPQVLVRDAVAGAQAGEVQVHGEAPAWPLDAARMRQVLTNLLQNARAASPDGQVTATLGVHDDTLRIDIADDGPGVPEADRDKLFEPFFTTRAQGTGLGLAIAQDIVQKHGGTLSVHDSPTGGALFRIEVPR